MLRGEPRQTEIERVVQLTSYKSIGFQYLLGLPQLKDLAR